MTNTLWTVQLGKLPSGEWAADVAFAKVTDTDWNAIRSLAEQYATLQCQGCPPMTIADRRLRFRLGNTPEKPQTVANLSAAECDTLQSSLVKCAEGLSKIGLGLWCLDRQLVWKIGESFLFVPIFWLPILCEKTALPPDIAPEQVGKTAADLNFSANAEIYTIASLCYWALTNRNYDRSRPLLPGTLNPNLLAWNDVFKLALQTDAARRPATFQEWMRSPTRKSLQTLPPPSLDDEPLRPDNTKSNAPNTKTDEPKITWDDANWDGHTPYQD